MSSVDLLYRDPSRDLAIERSDSLPCDAADLLARTRWGTRALEYLKEDVDIDLARLPPGHCLTLRLAGRAVGTLTLIPRSVTTAGVKHLVLYAGLFAVEAAVAGQGLGRLLAERARRRYFDEAEGPTLIYAVLEDGNERSLRIQRQMGLERLADFALTHFGYLRPRTIEGVEPLGPEGVAPMRAELEQFYRDHVLCEFEQSFIPEEYWVLRRRGRIVAGAQVVRRQVSVLRLAGVEGWLLQGAAPVLQRVSSFFRFRGRPSLWYCNLFHRGDARPLGALLEGLSRRFGVSAGAIYSDPRSPLCRALRRAGLGALAAIAPQERLSLMAAHKGLTPEAVARLRAGPVAFSGIDCT